MTLLLKSDDFGGPFYGFKLEWGVWGYNQCEMGTHDCTRLQQCVDHGLQTGFHCDCIDEAFRYN